MQYQRTWKDDLWMFLYALAFVASAVLIAGAYPSTTQMAAWTVAALLVVHAWLLRKWGFKMYERGYQHAE